MKPILTIHGATDEEVDRFSNLILQGTPGTLVIRTKYIPRKEQNEKLVKEDGKWFVEKVVPPEGIQRFSLDELSDLQSKASMQRAMVNKENDAYVVDRKNIDDEDYGVILYTKKISPEAFKIFDITLSSTTAGIDTNGNYIVFVSGNEDIQEIIQLISKAVPDPVTISSTALASYRENQERLASSDSVEDKNVEVKKNEELKTLTDDELRDRILLCAIAERKKLIIAEKKLFDDRKLSTFQDHAKSFRVTELSVHIGAKTANSPPDRKKKDEGKVDEKIPWWKKLFDEI